MPKRAFDDNNGIPPWVTVNPKPITVHLGTPEPAFPEGEARYEMRQGVLWQPCPTCGAKPGEGCVNLASGTTAQGFHNSRPDGYED